MEFQKKAGNAASTGESRELLKTASLFQGSFSIDWLLNLTGNRASDVLKNINSAINDKIIEEIDSGIYRFNSAQAKQDTRKTLGKTERRNLHLRAISILKNENQQDTEIIEEIAFQLSQTGDALETSQWLVKAGDGYNESAEFLKAIDCYRKAIDTIKSMSGIVVDHLLIDTVIKVQNILTFRRDSEWIAEILEEAYRRAELNGQMAVQSLIKLYQAVTLWHQGQYREAKETYEQVWAETPTVDDPRIMRLMVAISVHFLFWHCRFRDTVEMYEKSIQDVVTYSRGLFPLYSSITVAHAYAVTGQVNTGLGMLESIYTHSIKIKRYTVAGHALVNLAMVLLMLGRYDEALQTLHKAKHEIPSKDGYLAADIAQVTAHTLQCQQKYKESRKALLEYFSILEERELVRWPSYYLLVIAFAIKQGTYPPVPQLNLDDEINRALESENILFKGIAYYYLAFVQKEKGESDEKVLESMSRSLELLKESGHEVELARSRIESTRIYLSMGQVEKATENLKKAIETKSESRNLAIPEDLKFLVEQEPSKGDLLQDILKLGQDMVTIRDNKELVSYVVKTVNALTGAERGAIFMLKPGSSGDDVILRAAKNLTYDDISSPDFTPSLKMIQEVSSSGKGVIRKIDQNIKAADVPFKTIRSCMCVPMTTKNKTVGVLYHDNRFLASAFKKDDMKTLTYFAALAAIAIDNADAYEEIQRLNRKLTEEKKYYREQHLDSMNIGSFVGKSPAIRSVLKKVNKVANTDTTVLILGESGVGKELIAGTVLDNSSRRNKPFICVNCSAFSESLIASELFGHEKGAFTGANERRVGRFELADGGTLFLDEIGDIPMETQVRLLRILQTKQFERVGGTKTMKSDFRLITATNQNLEELVKAGRFREDLFYRLNVFPIHVPPLRKRKDDIPLLVSYFLLNFSKKTGKYFNKLSENSQKLLSDYHWPGNVRELENIIERSVVMSSEPELQIPELNKSGAVVMEENDAVTMAEMERRHLIWALEKTKWKIRGPGGAAELLDMHYSTLRSRIRKHGIKKQLVTVH
jgi:formate hydrogenlyase transcriptional activator